MVVPLLDAHPGFERSHKASPHVATLLPVVKRRPWQDFPDDALVGGKIRGLHVTECFGDPVPKLLRDHEFEAGMPLEDSGEDEIPKVAAPVKRLLHHPQSSALNSGVRREVTSTTMRHKRKVQGVTHRPDWLP